MALFVNTDHVEINTTVNICELFLNKMKYCRKCSLEQTICFKLCDTETEHVTVVEKVVKEINLLPIALVDQKGIFHQESLKPLKHKQIN